MKQLKAFGYKSGKLETFLKGFGFEPKKETTAKFCKRLWNVDIDSEDKPTIDSEDKPTKVES